MKAISMVIAVALMLTSVGCMENLTREEKAAAVGAVGGAAVGGLIGSKRADAGKGILIGAAAGAVGGYLVGKMSKPKEGEPATVECPYCHKFNEVPAGAKAGMIIQCGNPECGKQFQLQ